MKVISVIEDEDVIKKILKHLGLWDFKARPAPRKEKASGITETIMDYSARPAATPPWDVRSRKNQVWARLSQIPPLEDHLYFDVGYSVEDPDLSVKAAF